MSQQPTRISDQSSAIPHRLATVAEEQSGLAQRVTDLETGTTEPVIAHISGVPALEAGDTVAITRYPQGLIVTGRLRAMNEAPAGVIEDAEGRVTIPAGRDMTFQVGRSSLHLSADGVITIDGRTVHTLGDERVRLDSPSLELN